LEHKEPLGYETFEPDDDGGGLRWKEYNKIDPKTVDSLTAHQLFLLPQHLRGFALVIKEWSTPFFLPKDIRF